MANVVDVLVLGAGAAGLMAAMEAGQRGRRVLVVDHADRTGKKILISGGGRCNFTNLGCRSDHFLSANPHFAKSALARFTPADMVGLVERHGIRYHEKTLGQLFCDGSAKEIVRMLERECADANAKLQMGVRVLAVDRVADRFLVRCEGQEIETQSVIVATGGLSIPKMGASGFGYELARQFGHGLLECRPGLVPLTFGAEERGRWCDLAGVSAEVVAGVGKTRFREKLLVTHRGVSGPAVLQISSYWRDGGEVVVDLAPEAEVFAGLLRHNARRDAGAVVQAMRSVLPGRMAERWAAVHVTSHKGAEDWTNAGIARLEQAVHGWRLRPEGTEGYAKAEVTVGGVDTAGLDARTMESKLVKGLFFVGEVVDVTGWLGGYNFQWAWASGVAAGRAA